MGEEPPIQQWQHDCPHHFLLHLDFRNSMGDFVVPLWVQCGWRASTLYSTRDSTPVVGRSW